jgi:hypothetical protein
VFVASVPPEEVEVVTSTRPSWLTPSIVVV